MTRRQYFTDAYKRHFEARIRDIVSHENGTCDVILSDTYFYPESGGQPADHGQLAGIPIIEIKLRTTDQAVIHTLSQPIPTAVNDIVQGEVDWKRRFNHMQQHTGQHILSRAFINCFDSDTVGFHLSSDYCTIDLDHADFSAADIEKAEKLANQIIWDNRPIYTRFVSHKQAENLPLRKRPPVQDQQMRLIEIDQFDLNACGGTHVAHTGEVGQIKITKVEKRKKKLRLTFLCGSRAWQDYQRQNDILTTLSNELTTGQDALLGTIQKLRQEIKQQNKTIKKQYQTLLSVEAGRLQMGVQSENEQTWIVHVYDKGSREIGELRPLANILTQNKTNTIVLFGLAGDKAQLLFKCSADLSSVHMGNTLRKILPLINARAGGGPPDFAQGGNVPATADQLKQVLVQAKKEIEKQLV